MSSDLIGGYLGVTLDLNQPIKCAEFQLDMLLAEFYITGPKCINIYYYIFRILLVYYTYIR
jgi:hypothetical protein